MLGHRGIAQAEKFGELPNRALAVDQLTNNQQPMPVRKRLEKIACSIGSSFHG